MICNRPDCPGLKCKGRGEGCGVTEQAKRVSSLYEHPTVKKTFDMIEGKDKPKTIH